MRVVECVRELCEAVRESKPRDMPRVEEALARVRVHLLFDDAYAPPFGCVWSAEDVDIIEGVRRALGNQHHSDEELAEWFKQD